LCAPLRHCASAVKRIRDVRIQFTPHPPQHPNTSTPQHIPLATFPGNLDLVISLKMCNKRIHEMMRRKLMLVLLFVLVVLAAPNNLKAQSFRVVGYFSLNAALDDSGSAPLKYLTHVNLWFLNPDSAGNFSRDLTGLERFVKK